MFEENGRWEGGHKKELTQPFHRRHKNTNLFALCFTCTSFSCYASILNEFDNFLQICISVIYIYCVCDTMCKLSIEPCFMHIQIIKTWCGCEDCEICNIQFIER